MSIWIDLKSFTTTTRWLFLLSLLPWVISIDEDCNNMNVNCILLSMRNKPAEYSLNHHKKTVCFDLEKPDWVGTWRGMLMVSPPDAGPSGLEVTMELGPFPTATNNCTLWRSTFTKVGADPVVKDYRLCRRNSDEDLFTDERNGIILDTQWIGEQLVTPYKADNILYVAIDRLRGDIFEQLIITVNDTSTGRGIESLRTQAVYRTELKRLRR